MLHFVNVFKKKKLFNILISEVKKMVNICCVPGFKSGSRFNKDSEKITSFKFPGDIESRNKWLKSAPRANKTLNESQRVSAKHFSGEDFIKTSSAKPMVIFVVFT